MRAAGHRDGRGQRGAALLEMSVVVGLLALFVFGIISYGVTMSYKQTMAQAANEAARAAATAPRDLALGRAEAAANRAIGGHGTTCGDTSAGLTCSFTIDPCLGTAEVDCLTVRLTYELREHPRVASVPGVSATLPETLVSTAVVELNGP
ncbi:MAG: hypothetical protein JWM47_1508 [Acidimicrobiales bacterium]|nr:hypothetical protein [Acidimicrobiales bacterium]